MSNFDYYSFQVASTKQNINDEIEFYKNLPEVNIPGGIMDYYKYLVSRVTEEQFPIDPKTGDPRTQYPQLKKMNMADYSHEMDIMVFQKPWNKIRPFHKTMKLKEFIENLEYPVAMNVEKVKKNRDELIDELLKGFNDKRFNKNKNHIVYNIEKMMIESIPCIEKTKKGLYRIDWE